MLKKTVTYKDYNGVERTEDFYFNLNESEITKMELGVDGGLSTMLKKIVAAQDIRSVMDMYVKLILSAYGEKSADGRRFIKSEEISEAFSQTPAYNIIFMEMLKDSAIAAEFVNGIMPMTKDNIKADLSV